MTTDTAPMAQDLPPLPRAEDHIMVLTMLGTEEMPVYTAEQMRAYARAALAAAPAAAPRQPLTREQIKDLYGDNNNWDLTWPYVTAFARSIEQWHGIGGAPAPAMGEQSK